QLDYYTRVVGLSAVAKEKGRAILATKPGQEAIVLEHGEQPVGVRLAFNLLQADNANIHHLAFELRDEAEINRACDFLARKNIKLFWGPIRHLIGHNIAIYHKNPDGIPVEFFTDIDLMYDEELGYFEPRPWHQDRPQRPKVWGDDTPTNYWGPGHPHDMPGPKK